MTRPILKEEIRLIFRPYPTFEDVKDKTFLAIIDMDIEKDDVEMFVAMADSFGDLKFPDNGDDIGWMVQDIALWADLSDVYDVASRYLVMPGEGD